MSLETSVYCKMTKAEKSVSDFLKQKQLYWKYESCVYIRDNKDRPRIWTPDFYLPDLGIYIEVVCNEKDSNYPWRENIYSKNQVEIIFLFYHRKNWQYDTLKQIKDIQQSRWEKIKALDIE